MLEELHEVTIRIEKLSKAEHDLISDVHPQVSEIKEHIENVREVVSPEKSWRRVCHGCSEPSCQAETDKCKQFVGSKKFGSSVSTSFTQSPNTITLDEKRIMSA